MFISLRLASRIAGAHFAQPGVVKEVDRDATIARELASRRPIDQEDTVNGPGEDDAGYEPTMPS